MREEAERLMNLPVMTELDLPQKSSEGPARKLMSKLELDMDVEEGRDK